MPTFEKRILTLGLSFLLTVSITMASLFYPLSAQEISDLDRELQQMQEEVKNMDVPQSTIHIFTNNFLICLIMFIPLAGPLFGSWVLHNTGVVISASSIINGYPPLFVFLLLFIYPFTWLEFISYSLAFSQSFWLLWRIVQRRGREEIKNTVLFIGFATLLLLIGAYIEALIIAQSA
jgi:hypothetical protein